jgi:hypothetical protein
MLLASFDIFFWLVQVPVGTIVTPRLPTYIPKKLTFSRSLNLWQEDTRIKLQQTADSLLLRCSNESEIGDVWIGHSGDVVALAAATNEILTMVVEQSFLDQKDSDLSVEEWLEDVDWEEQERFSCLLLQYAYSLMFLACVWNITSKECPFWSIVKKQPTQ